MQTQMMSLMRGRISNDRRKKRQRRKKETKNSTYTLNIKREEEEEEQYHHSPSLAFSLFSLPCIYYSYSDVNIAPVY